MITLQGLIIAHDFDSQGNPVRFALLTNDEDKFILESLKKKSGITYARYNRSNVLLTGDIRYEDRKNVITVHEIKILS